MEKLNMQEKGQNSHVHVNIIWPVYCQFEMVCPILAELILFLLAFLYVSPWIDLLIDNKTLRSSVCCTGQCNQLVFLSGLGKDRAPLGLSAH